MKTVIKEMSKACEKGLSVKNVVSVDLSSFRSVFYHTAEIMRRMESL